MSPYLTKDEDSSPAYAHLLDLPALYTKPSAETLLRILTDFALPPPSWDDSAEPSSPAPPGFQGWLISILSSGLSWIKDPDTQEQILDLTSQRISENCGRTARGAMERKFLIPLLNDTTISPGSSGVSTPIGEPAGFDISPSSVAITLHEPGLTADNLGLKTWASSYMLSKRLAELAPILPSGARALELGAGTGLVGLAAAAVLGVDVLLTDLPEIVPNLARNIEANRHLGVEVEARVLDWREGPEEVVREEDKFGIVLVADPLYSAEHPKLLVGMVGKWLAGGREARCVVEMPLRKGYEREREDFRVRMGKRGLGVVVEGTEMGRDDWGDNGGDVECWWSVWGWAGME